MLDKTLTIILAGGVGSRLHPLTADRAKPAVPFGGADWPAASSVPPAAE